MRRKIVIGNWKDSADSEQTDDAVSYLIQAWYGVHQAEVCICPPLLFLDRVANALAHTNIMVGSQLVGDSSHRPTNGGLRASTISETGCRYVILSFSEGRARGAEQYLRAAEKHNTVRKYGMIPILCVGDTLAEFKMGKTFDVVGRQLLKAVKGCGLEGVAKGMVAYQPAWSLLSFSSEQNAMATLEFVQEVHSYIREILGPEGDQVRIVFGGDCAPKEYGALFAKKDIDGMLMSEYALNTEVFLSACRIAETRQTD